MWVYGVSPDLPDGKLRIITVYNVIEFTSADVSLFGEILIHRMLHHRQRNRRQGR